MEMNWEVRSSSSEMAKRRERGVLCAVALGGCIKEGGGEVVACMIGSLLAQECRAMFRFAICWTVDGHGLVEWFEILRTGSEGLDARWGGGRRVLE
jgi:hypothetical protein